MYNFNADAARDAIVEGIKKLSEEQGWTKAVIGISGGKDSTICAALLVRALGKENVYGVLLPDGDQCDIEDSYKVVKALGINYRLCNIGSIHDKVLLSVINGRNANEFNVDITKEADINVGPRIRMTVLRLISQSLHARLCGTGNLSESYVGYCTKDGDTSCDFNPIGFLTSIEVVKMGLTMSEIPTELVEKTPTDGLSGMSDEEKLGVQYIDIHNYIRNNGDIGNKEVEAKIKDLHAKSEHKRRLAYRILESKCTSAELDYKYKMIFNE